MLSKLLKLSLVYFSWKLSNVIYTEMDFHLRLISILSFKYLCFPQQFRSICESLLATANGTSNGQASNGQSSSKTNGSSSSSVPAAKVEEKKASDISHLVRRKRKPSEEPVVEGASVAVKKLSQ